MRRTLAALGLVIALAVTIPVPRFRFPRIPPRD